MQTNTPAPLYSNKKGSIGYKSLSERLPNIVTKLIDWLHRMAAYFLNANRVEESEDLLQTMQAVVTLRHNLMRCNDFEPFTDICEEHVLWNHAMEDMPRIVADPGQDTKTWRTYPFLFSECYYYNKLHEIFLRSKYSQKVDYFQEFKKASLGAAEESIRSLSQSIHAMCHSEYFGKEEVQNNVHSLILLSLWNNKLDLSASSGEQTNPMDVTNISQSALKHEQHNLLVDESWDAARYIASLCVTSQNNKEIHMVIDNAGAEFVCDLFLSNYLLKCGAANKVIVHIKAFPWFVSDVTKSDVDYTLSFLNSSYHVHLSHIGSSLTEYIKNGCIEIRSHIVWTTFLTYSCIPKEQSFDISQIYQEFTNASLVVFKGDLNYRKLVGDLNWDPFTPLRDALGPFTGFPMLVLRTIKSDAIVGLTPTTLQMIGPQQGDARRESGEYGVIHFLPA